MNQITNEKGLTLIEVVASIVIITIILISFFGLFVQSKKTNVSSESIQDATYYAQKEMESIYLLSKNQSLSGFSSSLNLGSGTSYQKKITQNNICTTPVNESNLYQVKNKHIYTSSGTFESKLTISELCNFTNAAKVLIEVYEKGAILEVKPADFDIIVDEKYPKKAIVENVYIFKP